MEKQSVHDFTCEEKQEALSEAFQMMKERGRVERLENMSPIAVSMDGNVLISGEDWHWLTEQAELLQLERQGAALANKINSAYVKEVMDENKRFREVLRFYADKENHEKEEFKSLRPNAKSIMMSTVEWDDGDKAREALEESK